jgi:ribose transport system substrate-binding protein
MTRITAHAARLPRMAAAATALVAALITIAACSSSSSSSTSDAPSASSSSSATASASSAAASAASASSSSGVPAAVTALLDAGYKGTFQPPPASGPKAAAGKKVWVISCGQIAATCASIADAAVQAGKALGWQMTLFDGKLDPTLYSTGILQAIADHANGILTVAVDCADAKSPLEQAKAAGIMTVTVSGFDCNNSLDPTGPPVYSTFIKYTGIPDYGTTYADWKKYDAAWDIAATDGKAKVINTYSPGYLVSEFQNQGFTDEMKLCPTCSIVDELGITATDQEGSGAQDKLQSALLQNADADVVQVGVDDWFERFANAAFKEVNRSSLMVSGDECSNTAIAEIKAGGPQKVCIARDFTWESWAAMDELNRQFASPGSAPVNEGLGFEIVDATHNLPSGATWVDPFNFEAAYQKIWSGQ